MINHEVKEGIAEITLDNPKNHNAFSDILIKNFNKIVKEIDTNEKIKCVLIKASGKNFSSGADLKWMQSIAKNSRPVNKEDALFFARFLYRLNTLAKPVMALVQGRVFGGAIGILACCDVVIAESSAQFCFSEIKLGLMPATIAPYILQCLGHSHARHLFLTAESFDAQRAQQLGLVHLVCDEGALSTSAEPLLKQFQSNPPHAMAAIKQLIHTLDPIDNKMIDFTAEALAERRASDEAQEGLSAFFEKRKPSWD